MLTTHPHLTALQAEAKLQKHYREAAVARMLGSVPWHLQLTRLLKAGAGRLTVALLTRMSARHALDLERAGGDV